MLPWTLTRRAMSSDHGMEDTPGSVRRTARGRTGVLVMLPAENAQDVVTDGGQAARKAGNVKKWPMLLAALCLAGSIALGVVNAFGAVAGVGTTAITLVLLVATSVGAIYKALQEEFGRLVETEEGGLRGQRAAARHGIGRSDFGNEECRPATQNGRHFGRCALGNSSAKAGT